MSIEGSREDETEGFQLEKIKEISGTGVHISGSDIDTDRIIPARFLKCITFDFLGAQLFYDVRFDEGGNPKDHPLNNPKFDGASILVGGVNFGCGSSREHAPQSIMRAGFEAIIAEGYAEIFFGNCTTLGIPCVTVSKEDREKIARCIENTPHTDISIDLESQQILFDGESVTFDMPESARTALLKGQWDPIVELMDASSAIEKLESSLPQVVRASVKKST